MADQIQDEATAVNYEHFRDSLSAVLVQRLTRAHPAKTSRRSRKQAAAVASEASAAGSGATAVDDAEDLSEFIEYIAGEIFMTLPPELQTLDHHTWSSTPALQDTYSLPLTAESVAPLLLTLDPSVGDSLLAYGIVNSTDATGFAPTRRPTRSEPLLTVHDLLAPVLTSYLTAVTTPPPPPSSTRGKVTACEICGRDWINLSYHHLIPRMVHAKVVKRGWHRADELQNVAWLCGACHRFVHQFAGHEDLARRYYTVDLLLEQPEIVAWAEWVGKLRWKGVGSGKRRRA